MINAAPSINVAIPKLPADISGLEENSLNLWWTWNPRDKNLFRLLNAYLWKESSHNPILMLRNMSQDELDKACSDEHFMREYNTNSNNKCNF